MPALKKALLSKLKNAKKIAVLGIGSEIRGDDAIGMIVARKLSTCFKKNKIKSVKVFLGQTAPENLTGEIKKFKPSHLIMIDALDFNQAPGTICVLDSYKEAGPSFSSHKMPMHIMQDYLLRSIECKSIIIGIQPQSCHFCLGPSAKIQACSLTLPQQILSILKGL